MGTCKRAGTSYTDYIVSLYMQKVNFEIGKVTVSTLKSSVGWSVHQNYSTDADHVKNTWTGKTLLTSSPVSRGFSNQEVAHALITHFHYYIFSATLVKSTCLILKQKLENPSSAQISPANVNLLLKFSFSVSQSNELCICFQFRYHSLTFIRCWDSFFPKHYNTKNIYRSPPHSSDTIQ